MDNLEAATQDTEVAKRSTAEKKPRAKQKIRVIELFAGVGGFRLGLDGKTLARRKSSPFQTVWANQWEPGTKLQHAATVYQNRFPDAHDFPFFNEDISRVIDKHFDEIPDHDLLCGGFPCQDYSVARPLNQASGIAGRKGVLWWSIHDILEKKGPSKRPKYLMLENVDRLLKSPAKQRGRDFAIMLASLANLGYAVEWRVVNAADYGFHQRRRRIFIVGFHKSTAMYQRLQKCRDAYDWIRREGVFARSLPVQDFQVDDLMPTLGLEDGRLAATKENLIKITREFNRGNKQKAPFENAGVMLDFDVWTAKVTPKYSGNRHTLGDVLVGDRNVPAEYWIKKSEIDAPKGWKYLKGAKSEKRTKKDGFVYSYDEGAMSFPDPTDKPSRTIITSEGGTSPSRFKHVIKTRKGYRRLVPVELEQLNGFPKRHTELDGVSDVRRAFFMGNALVVGVVDRVGREFAKQIRARKRR